MKTLDYEKLKGGAEEFAKLVNAVTIGNGLAVLNMPNDDYHAGPGIGNSGLNLIARSPAHFYFAPPQEPNRFKEIGSAIHCALLEPERFAADYVLLKDVKDRRSSAYKEANKVHPGEFLLTGPEADNIVGMQQAVYAQRHARAVLETKGTREAAIYSRDPETGVLVRAKYDILTDSGRAIDLKKTQDARPSTFSRSAFNYRYHCQTAFYSDVFEWATGDKLAAFAILAVEEKIPHAAMLYVLDDQAVEAGRALYRSALNIYAKCLEQNHWPAYGEEPQILSLPPWAERSIENELNENSNEESNDE